MFNLNILKNRKRKILDCDNYQNSAILIPLIGNKNQYQILFEIRSQKLNFQPGEICFPGGGIIKEDTDEKAAAIRETCEELNLTQTNIEVIGELDILVTPFNSTITPFVSIIKADSIITPNPEEVDSVFFVPLKFFLDNKPKTYYTKTKIEPPSDFPYELISNNKSYNWQKGLYPVYFYIYKEKVIWGITARIIKNFIDIIQNKVN